MTDSIFLDDLYKEFGWYDSLFTPVVENCSKDFFYDGLDYKLVSISTNMNVLAQNDMFFVTKVKINAKNDVYIRISQAAINVILDKVLGKNNRKFELTEVSELEANIITAFNDSIYEALKPNFHVDPHRRYTEILHLTYYVKNESSDAAAKFIISVPRDILSPEPIQINEPHFTDNDFLKCPVETSFLIGSTTFPLADIKRLEVGDVVVFEHSDSSKMTLVAGNIRQEFQVKPDSKIVEPFDSTGGMEEKMENSNLWDNIQVDMFAEFDKVKVPLGDLKSIEEGLVVDLCSVYDNKVYLKVGGLVVASGNLVIINDRFGVRIEQVSESNTNATIQNNQPQEENNEDASENKGEDFDYSDFEVEDKQD